MNYFKFLEDIKIKHDLKSDSDLARHLKLTRQAISAIKHGGGFDENTAIKIARSLGINEERFVLQLKIDQAKEVHAKRFWKKLLSKVAMIPFAAVILSGAYSNDLNAQSMGYKNISNLHSIYYAHCWTHN